MLSITECAISIREAKKLQIKGRIIQNFYEEILSNAQISKIDGTITVDFKNREYDLALEATKELLENDFNLKKYVTLNDRFLEDKEITLEFDLKKPFRNVDNKSKVCNNYCEDDIPFQEVNMKRHFEDFDGMEDDLRDLYLSMSKGELVDIIMEHRHDDQNINDFVSDWMTFTGGEVYGDDE